MTGLECVSGRAAALLAELVRCRTVNPPGRESRPDRILRRFASQAGLVWRTLTVCPGRPHLVLEVPGRDPALPPLVAIGHLDVVRPGDGWTVPPFAGRIAAGWVWGRGALDAKGLVAVWATLLAELANCPRPPLRTVRLIGAADEEGEGKCGLGPLLERHPELGRAGAAIGEGGGYLLRHGNRRFTAVAVAECGVAAAPPDFDPGRQVQVGSAGEAFLRALARSRRLPQRRLLEHLLASVPETEERVAFTSWLEAVADAVGLPTRGVADLFLPLTVRTPAADSTPGTHLISVPPGTMGAEAGTGALTPPGPGLRWQVRPTASPAKGRIYEAISRALGRERRVPGGKATEPLPVISRTRTDLRFFRERGVPAYGFFPLGPEDDPRRMHGPDERISLVGLGRALQLLGDVVEDLAGDGNEGGK